MLLLYENITQALKDYGRELTDILDYVSDDEEIESYGQKAEELNVLIQRWHEYIEKEPEPAYVKIRIHDADAKLVDNEDLACSCLEKFSMNPETLYRDAEDPTGVFTVLLEESKLSECTTEGCTVTGRSYSIVRHPRH